MLWMIKLLSLRSTESTGGRPGSPRVVLSLALSPPGLLLDATNNFSYLFYLSTFILVLTALFMGGSFYVLQKREQGRQSKAQGDTPKDKDTPEKQLCPENTNVTNL